MEESAASIDECVNWLEQQVLDLLNLRGIISKLSTNWGQLKLLLREKGLLKEGDIQPEDDSQGPPPPGPAVSVESAQAFTAPGKFITPSGPNGASEGDVSSQNTESSAEQRTESFIGPVIPMDAVRATAKDVEVVNEESGSTAVGFIGPVVPDRAPNEQEEVAVVEQNGNGTVETPESAAVQSSGLQMS